MGRFESGFQGLDATRRHRAAVWRDLAERNSASASGRWGTYYI